LSWVENDKWERFFVALRKAKEGFLNWVENDKREEILRRSSEKQGKGFLDW